MMKRFYSAPLLAAVPLALAAPAWAQSSVTLFGIADLNVRSVKNGDNTVRSLSNSGMSSSRLGLRGVEDLGDGLRAGFWLEHGVNLDTGTQADSARFWNRRATVSLSGAFGELRLGRDQVPTFTGFADYDVFGTNGVADGNKFSNRFGTAANTQLRADNMVSYFTPSMGGFRAQLSVAAGEGTLGSRYIGTRVGYAAGPLDVSLSYGTTEVAANAAGDDDFTMLNVAGSYNLGLMRLLAYYSRNEYGVFKQDTFNIGVSIPLGSGALRASYINADASGGGIDANDASQVAVGYIHNLSRRTALYTTYARVSNDGRAAFAVAAVPALPNPNVSARDSSGFELGIRHSF